MCVLHFLFSVSNYIHVSNCVFYAMSRRFFIESKPCSLLTMANGHALEVCLGVR